ncbi:ATP synthase F1 subunit epsilon [Candidatus Nomurabacteria bacterium RIFCSPHIGHO2_02_FULL_42_24]|uniref:ATP synthase epsilon chain n=1 Tax=Candidatus Nomurabacteria bacterium RIFCSPHIGHO2_02_FULL_42_24 TaxID=1801757 RepID=A0A1F6WGG3_9BACT|nr:MAG: ATP synthase epsilon chain [Parcubacteria group bacterium GW2011_GWA2_42_18]OGI80998.1 MAG: ATP synthase F1 subunit epsilon [Candidatus Nomurabacteria bacterium RIFCSPHIGHO2_02_FULL_42_24]
MPQTLKLKIVTPERVVLEEEIEQVTLPTTSGQITILPDHVPLVSELASGDIVAMHEGEAMPIAVVGGLLRVSANEVTILADFAEHVGEMAEDDIEKARTRAEKLRGEKDKVSKEEFEHFATELERSLTRTRIAEKWRGRKYRRPPKL